MLTFRGIASSKKFPVKFIGPNLFFPWLLVFLNLTGAFVLVLFTTSRSHPHPLYRRTRPLMFFKIGVLKNFASFTEKHQSWSLPAAASIYVTFHECFSFTSPLAHFHYFLTVLLLSSFEETLLFLCHYYYTRLIS